MHFIHLTHLTTFYSLYEEFNFHSQLSFYGKMFGMSADDIKEREDFLCDFLSLPVTSRVVSKMSGGQQRRVSLACALLHQPPLLLLDEPTVGVDPQLRAKIWKHLRTLAAQGTTILITTHYIAEAVEADEVAFMRSGRILKQGPPLDVMNELRCSSLEDAFLKLCSLQSGDDAGEEDDIEAAEQDEESGHSTHSFRHPNVQSNLSINQSSDGLRARSSHSRSLQTSLLSESSSDATYNHPIDQSAEPIGASDDQSIDQSLDQQHNSLMSKLIPRWTYLWACVWRNMMRFITNLPALAFVFLLPSIQVCLFCLAIGADPRNIKFGLVNYDNNTYNGTTSVNLTQTMIGELDSRFQLTTFTTEADAYDAARDANVWGYAVIPANYSANIAAVAQDPSLYSTDCCVVRYALDESSAQIAAFVQKSLSATFLATLTDTLGPNVTQALPVQAIDPPIYGSSSSSFTDFIAPGMIITIAFSQSIGLTALIFVVDGKSGVTDRAYSCGLRSSELMASHAIVQIFILSIQIAILLFFGLIVFDLPMEGSIFLVFVICLSLAFCGVLYGLVIAALCTEERQAMQLALGSFFPALLLSGIIWPLEAIPVPLNYLSMALPTTWAAAAGRDVMSRGWGVDRPEVWQALLIIAGWNTALFVFAVIKLKTQQG